MRMYINGESKRILYLSVVLAGMGPITNEYTGPVFDV